MATGKLTQGNRSVTIYFYAESAPGKEEGTIFLRRQGKLGRYVIDPDSKPAHFDRLDDIPAKIRELLAQASPPESEG